MEQLEVKHHTGYNKLRLAPREQEHIQNIEKHTYGKQFLNLLHELQTNSFQAIIIQSIQNLTAEDKTERLKLCTTLQNLKTEYNMPSNILAFSDSYYLFLAKKLFTETSEKTPQPEADLENTTEREKILSLFKEST